MKTKLQRMFSVNKHCGKGQILPQSTGPADCLQQSAGLMKASVRLGAPAAVTICSLSEEGSLLIPARSSSNTAGAKPAEVKGKPPRPSAAISGRLCVR